MSCIYSTVIHSLRKKKKVPSCQMQKKKKKRFRVSPPILFKFSKSKLFKKLSSDVGRFLSTLIQLKTRSYYDRIIRRHFHPFDFFRDFVRTLNIVFNGLFSVIVPSVHAQWIGCCIHVRWIAVDLRLSHSIHRYTCITWYYVINGTVRDP